MNEPNTQPIPAYPIYDLSPTCLEVGAVISQNGGAKVGVDRSQLAAGLGVDEQSSTLAARIASARSFGIITGPRELRLTTAGTMYFEPKAESDQRRARLAFLASPPSFSKFIEAYDGSRLPVGKYLTNIFAQMGVGKSWAARVATIFTKAADVASVLDPQGYLRYKAAMKGAMPPATPEAVEAALSTPSPSVVYPSSPEISSLQPSKSYEGANVWVFSAAGAWVKVETPQDISIELWDKLNKYIQIIKPSEEVK